MCQKPVSLLFLFRQKIRTYSTKDRLPSVLLRRTNSEGKDGLVERAILDHVVERRDDLVDRDGIVGQSKDSIKLACQVKRKKKINSTPPVNVNKESRNGPKAKASPGSLVDSAKSCFLTVMSPMLSTSFEMKPSRDPDP